MSSTTTNLSNPLKVMRLSHSLTMDQLAAKVGCGRLLIVRNEQGVYVRPSPKLFQWLLDMTGESESTQLRAYYKFQEQTRLENYGKLRDDIDFTMESLGGIPNPLIKWRLTSEPRLNPTQVAKLFCIHPIAIHKVEKQPWLANSIPTQIIQALTQSGYSKELLTNFEQAFVNYKQYRSEQVTSAVGF